MNPTFENIHNRFRLNGNYYDREDLKEVAYSFVKEGKSFEKSIGEFLMDWLDDGDYVRVKTSGSTGEPKSIDLHKQHMVNSAIASGDFFGISVGDSALHCLPARFIAGKMMLVRAMILGLEIDLIEPSLNPLANISREYDFSAMIPLQVMNSLGKLDQIKKIIVGGAPVSKELIEGLQDRKTLTFETYGMTETVTHIAAKQLNNFRSTTALRNAHFRVLPNITISVDERNCLIIDAPNISNETIVTNDIVHLVAEDAFDWLGRYDNVINSGGIKLIPEQIEDKLAEYINRRYFVYGIPDEKLGEKMVLVIEGSESEKQDFEERISKIKSLDKYELPKDIFFSESFDETENAKVIRSSTIESILNGKK
ncbi:AMP-binding protein [Robertkochia solimangrovi]|uniref:AMP-binding protein n=1 Tax=Robertkochia solimangrovi TaxID=2213046 RepID=UPI00117C2DCA|nr:AMP-binding protein [Robertkochia solimangrovi]TRZ45399.1 O-succinylbenzoic acid--CoA ligase [Robertkochia solimangrovi]